MSGERETIWDIESHTLAKHAILRRYLQAWFPIMTSRFKGINYIDGFAGPGKYKGGEEGSPIIALNTAIELNKDLTKKIAFTFIENDKSRFDNLKSALDSMQIPGNFKFEIINNKFDETLNKELSKLNEQNVDLAPCFAFIDPFGFSDTPFSVIERIMSFPRCEVLITFMSRDLNRFKDLTINREHISKLLGTTDWNPNMFVKGENAIADFYQKRLSDITQYVRSFEMRSEANQPIYRLIFATNNILGLKRMKEAMWRVDKTGNFSYSDFLCFDVTDNKQTTLFKPEPNYNELKKLITDNFSGKMVTVKEVEDFVVLKTPYRENHYKKILKEMELANPPEVEVNGSVNRRRGTYKDEMTTIKFIAHSANTSKTKDQSKPKRHSQSTLF